MKHKLTEIVVLEYDFRMTGHGKCPYDLSTVLKSPIIKDGVTQVFCGKAVIDRIETGWSKGPNPNSWTAYFSIIPEIE